MKTPFGNRLYHRHFSSLRGVDVSSDPSEVSPSRFADMANMWRDPKAPEGSVTETFPGYRGVSAWEGACFGLYRHTTDEGEHLVAHVGDRLYRFPSARRHFPHELSELPPLKEGVPQKEGVSFPVGEDLYLFIGGDCYRIDKAGCLHLFGEEGCRPYLPTTFVEGSPYEQRNLLSDEVCHRFTLTPASYREETTVGLSFSVLDEEAGTCAVRARSSLSAPVVEIPETVTVGKKTYTVTKVMDYGFTGLRALRVLRLPETLTEIGEAAFSANPLLRIVALPDSLKVLGSYAFYNCSSLKTVYLGTSLVRVRSGAFSGCPIETAYFGKTLAEVNALTIEGDSLFATSPTHFYYSATPPSNPFVSYRLPVPERCVSLTAAYLNDTLLTVGNTEKDIRLIPKTAGGVISAILLEADDEQDVLDTTLRLYYRLAEATEDDPDSVRKGKGAVLGCTSACAFDGKMFYGGNPALPGTVFYSSLDSTGYNDPLYVGVLNYFKDGLRPAKHYTLASLGDRLAVITGDGVGEGEIFFHSSADTGEDLLPRIYPLAGGIVGPCGFGTPLSFGGETLLLTARGLMAFRRASNDASYRLVSRSAAINARLCKEDLSKARMASHEGVLYLLTEGRVYLACDGGDTEPEWYLLSDVGCYTGGSMIAHYTARLPDEAKVLFDKVAVSSRVGEVAEGETYSVRLADGTLFYYTMENGVAYPVDSEGEMQGGSFSSATCLAATADALFFGAREGGLGCFNTDLREKSVFLTYPSPLYIHGKDGYLPLDTPSRLPVSGDAVALLPVYRKKGDSYTYVSDETVYVDGAHRASLAFCVCVAPSGIHPLFYSFDGRRYPAFLLLAPDDGGLPHYRKDTLAGSPTVKLKSALGIPSVLVKTDRHPFRPCDKLGASALDFSYADFSAWDFGGDSVASVSVREKERGWCYKQYLFRTDGFRSPFGVYALSYSYYTAGRPKG